MSEVAMMHKFELDMVVAVVRSADNKVLDTVKIDKINDKEIRTETPYEQLTDPRNELSRRYWRTAAPYTEMRIPREEKATRAPCTIRPATKEDEAIAQRRVAVRRAKMRMPLALRNKEEYERQLKLAEDLLKQRREPYERLLEQIHQDQILLASEDE